MFDLFDNITRQDHMVCEAEKKTLLKSPSERSDL